jgi:hypothetical protein
LCQIPMPIFYIKIFDFYQVNKIFKYVLMKDYI